MTEQDAVWLEWRRQGIGGSDIGSLLGLSKWASRWSLWADKRGLIPPSPTTERQQIGHDAERFLADVFTRRTGLYVTGEQMQCSHPGFPFAQCTLDGLVSDATDAVVGTVQFKTTAERGWSPGYIPPAVLAQCQWELGVTGQPLCWLVVGFAGWNIEVYEVLFDEADWKFMLAEAANFWALVRAGTPPMLDGSDATTDALAIVYPTAISDQAIELDDLLPLIEQRARLKALNKDLADQAKAIDNRVKGALALAEVGTVNGMVAVIWPTQGGRKTICSACGNTDHGESFRVLNYKKLKDPS